MTMRRRTVKLTVISALVTATPYPSSASSNDVEVIVVSANQQQQSWLNSAASVSVKRLPDAGLLIDSGQVLQGIPGLQVDSRANFAQDTRLSIRGFGSRSAFGVRGLYLQQDGIPISAPDGQGQLSSVLLDNISHIEVLRGPLAVLYGNGAGGVISITSANPTDQVSGSIARSAVHQQYLVQANQQTEHANWQFAAKQFETDGFRPHSAAKKQQVLFGWQQAFANDLTLRLKVDWSDDPLLQDPLSLSDPQWRTNPHQTTPQAQQFDTVKQTQQHQVSISLAQGGNAPWQLAVWQGTREVAQRLAFTGEAISSAGGDIALSRAFKGLNTQKSWQLTDMLNMKLGMAWVSSNDARKGYVNQFGQRGDLRRDERNIAENRDLYWRFSYQPLTALTIEGGVRYTELHYRIDDFFIRPNNPDDSGAKTYYQQAAALGLNYQINTNWAWFLSSGLGFEAPTLAELAYKPQGTGVNLDLAASENRQWESGLKYAASEHLLSLSVFRILSTDELIVASSNNGRTSYQNAGKTQRNGMELMLEQRLHTTLSHALSLTWLDARFAADTLQTTNRLPGVAKLDAYWQLTYQPLPTLPLKLSWTTIYRSPVATTDDNSTFAPAAVSFYIAASMSQSVNQFRINYWLSVTNATDRDNVGAVVVNQTNGRAFEPAPSRHFNAGFEVAYPW